MCFGAFQRFFIKAFFVISIAHPRFLGLLGGPSLPTRLPRCCDFEFNAINGTNRDTQFTTCAKRLNHRVHAFVRTDDGIGWTCI
jgi:hypothetical protein